MTLHLFEGPVKGPVCYCVPGGAASCATCRERRTKANAAEEVADLPEDIWPKGILADDDPKRGDAFVHGMVAPELGPRKTFVQLTPRYGTSPAKEPLVADWIEAFMKARDKALTEGWLKGVDVAEQDDDKTIIWHTSTNSYRHPNNCTCKDCEGEPA